ncbi:hypothetical protein ASF80_00835 [Microbacterium sp. Leaf159]|nr:hypothetical protein ASF80_00835 [Microbacterium sp. Leaf159]
MATPTTSGAIHPESPKSGFGNPNTSPCHEPRFLLHWMNGLTSQASASVGFSSSTNFSTVSWKAANQPTTLAMISQTA